jgi:uncharacterized damage-inducible protein DinB
MNRSDELKQLFVFNRWATGRFLAAAAQLPAESFEKDMGNSFRSIRDTLLHIMSSEWVWISRLNGTSPTGMPAEWNDLDLAGIEQQWAELNAEVQRFVGVLSDGELDAEVAYRSIAGDSYVSSRAQILRHMVNHATYHRGQIATMLRQLGSAGPSTDLIAFYRTT